MYTIWLSSLFKFESNFDYNNYYFVWVFDIKIIEIATKANQTSWIEQSTSNFQTFQKSEYVEKWKQENFESWNETTKNANKSNVSSCLTFFFEFRFNSNRNRVWRLSQNKWHYYNDYNYFELKIDDDLIENFFDNDIYIVV